MRETTTTAGDRFTYLPTGVQEVMMLAPRDLVYYSQLVIETALRHLSGAKVGVFDLQTVYVQDPDTRHVYQLQLVNASDRSDLRKSTGLYVSPTIIDRQSHLVHVATGVLLPRDLQYATQERLAYIRGIKAESMHAVAVELTRAHTITVKPLRDI